MKRMLWGLLALCWLPTSGYAETQSYCLDHAKKMVTLYRDAAKFPSCRPFLPMYGTMSDLSKIYNHCLHHPSATLSRELFEAQLLSKSCPQCVSYVQKAVRANFLNARFSCGHFGPIWHSNTAIHMRWCMSRRANRETSDHERIREVAISNCRNYCPQYARESVTQAKENQKHRCGFVGLGWHTNYNIHFRWCNSTSLAQGSSNTAELHLRNRKQDLFRCKSYCRAYTSRAVQQNRENQQHRCGFVGLGWHNISNVHETWCRSVSMQEADRHIRERQQALDRCKSYCVDYANKSVVQQRENVRFRCGFWGFAWHSNYTTHYNWCKGVSNSESQRHFNDRARDLQRCRSRR